MQKISSTNPPRVGMLATVRNRRGLISGVEPFDGGTDGRLHLVTVEYTDAESPSDDQLIWEREINTNLLEPTALPDPSGTGPMPNDEFDALVRATRWTAISPFLDPDGEGPLPRLPISAPFHGAVQVDDYQLVPLLKALQMPRISLLIADDVGLGKTIEAGLILAELLIRRRIRRVLIITPASLRSQWREEMHDKFSLTFDEVDRESTHDLRKKLGLDANPWRTFPRIVTSYYYLKQPDVLEEFRAACRVPEGSPHLPWDLLIVDEAHNLTPAAYGEDSELAKMLAQLTPYFEHKLFLTATPHNGHTRSFTGLLERLDPVRFSQTDEIKGAEQARIKQVVIRRLKSDINARTEPKRFCERTPIALSIKLSQEERALGEAFQVFRKKVRSLIAQSKRSEQMAGNFAVEILGKRLLSCPVAFADSWHRYQQGLIVSEPAEASEVQVAERAIRDEAADDRETEERMSHAVRVVGAWLKPLAAALQDESAEIDHALQLLNLEDPNIAIGDRRPSQDQRLESLFRLIEERLRVAGKSWRQDERLIVFTEYKTTLDFLKARLRERYPDSGVIRVLYGSMKDPQEGSRKDIIQTFNDPADPVRILVATDAASEGLNLQETARYLLHFDVPWNPARIEQRNGRLDRHGQSRDVTTYHFTSNDDADLAFLGHVVGKIHTIREDLGSMGDVFDAAFEQWFVKGEEGSTIKNLLDERIEQAKGRANIPCDTTIITSEMVREDQAGEEEAMHLAALANELDLDAETLKDTLDIALTLGTTFGRPRISAPDENGRHTLCHPIPHQWAQLIDDTLRLPNRMGQIGQLPGVVFDPQYFIENLNGRAIFRPKKDTVLLHLAHPIYHRALATFAHKRFPGGNVSRWTVRHGGLPAGADALLLVTVEELAVNELRETFHHWIRTFRFPIWKDELGTPLSHEPAHRHRMTTQRILETEIEQASAIWNLVFQDIRQFIKKRAGKLTETLQEVLKHEYQDARKTEVERFQSRQGEVSALIEQQTLAKLEREIAELQRQQRQGLLFDSEQRLEELIRSEEAKKEELARRRSHYEELRNQLTKERDRVIEHLLPKRFALRGDAQVFPVTIEIRLPEGKG